MFKLAKRTEMSAAKQTVIRIVAVIGAILATSIFIASVGQNPINVFKEMILGSVGKLSRIKDTITVAVPLIITSLGLIIAFKMKFWNIGAEGQIGMGAFAATFFALTFKDWPIYYLIPTMMLSAILVGGLWALIAAVLKVKFNTNETITTLMLNYIAYYWITYLQHEPWKDPKSFGFAKIANFTDNATMPKIFGLNAGIFISIVLALIIFYFLKYSKRGYEISVIGESEDTARYAGMSVKKIILYSVFISGAICGLAGMIQVSAVNGTLTRDVAGGYGYTAIITSWLSMLKPIAVVPVCFLFAMLINGNQFIQSAFNLPASAANIIQSLILFFVLGSEFFINFKFVRFKKSKEENL